MALVYNIVRTVFLTLCLVDYVFFGCKRDKGEPIKERRVESEDRPRAIREVEIALQLARKVVDLYNGKDPKYDHIPQKEMDKVLVAIKECEGWLETCRQKFNQNYKPYMPIPIKVKDIQEQRRILENKINPIINAPKPKVDSPKDDSKKKEDGKAKQPADSASANHNAEQNPTGDSQAMEVE